MYRTKAAIFILLTAVLVSGQAFCQEDINDHQARTIIGQVSKLDEDSTSVYIRTGAIAKQALSDAHLKADLVWGELIKSGYIDTNGTIQLKFYALDKFSNLLLPKMSNGRKKLICKIFQKALIDNGETVFEISLSSDLMRDTHRIVSLEIEPGDPVTIQYNSSSSGKNNLIRLVDHRPDDD